MGMIIECACGTVIRGSAIQDLLDSARSHIRRQHPAVGEPPTDEDLLAMAIDEPGGPSRAQTGGARQTTSVELS